MENRIRELRKNAKLSQETVAKAAGMSQSALSKVERGVLDIAVSKAKLIARQFRCGLDELFPFKCDKKVKESLVDL